MSDSRVFKTLMLLVFVMPFSGKAQDYVELIHSVQSHFENEFRAEGKIIIRASELPNEVRNEFEFAQVENNVWAFTNESLTVSNNGESLQFSFIDSTGFYISNMDQWNPGGINFMKDWIDLFQSFEGRAVVKIDKSEIYIKAEVEGYAYQMTVDSNHRLKRIVVSSDQEETAYYELVITRFEDKPKLDPALFDINSYLDLSEKGNIRARSPYQQIQVQQL